jgi:hypothetical protein
MVDNHSINERISIAENELRRGDADRVDMWKAINELRPMSARMDSRMDAQDVVLSRIEGLCQDKDKRIKTLEDTALVEKTQRNLIIGMASIIGGLSINAAIWIITNFTSVKKMFNLT